MARVQTSAIVSDVRGKVGGSVFQRSAQGLSLRTHSTPTNPRTNAQASSRSNLYALQVAWMSLTQDQRQAWDAWAQYQNLSTGYFSTCKMTGQQAFIQLNRYRSLAGLSILSNPVFTPYTLPAYTVSWKLNGATLYAVFSGFTDHTTYHPLLFCSGVSNASRNTPHPLRFIPFAYAAAEVQWTTSTDYAAIFGQVPAVGQQIFVQHGILQTSNSTLSVFSREKVTIVAL